MGIVNTRRIEKVNGVCRICGRRTSNALVVKGKWFIDEYGERRRAADSLYHRECRTMQNRGLLNSGTDRPHRDSTGKSCGGCSQVIESGSPHAHRSGIPFHKECL